MTVNLGKREASAADRALKARIKLEKRVVKLTIDTLLEEGYVLSVYDGEETTVSKSRDAAALLDAMMTTDEDYIFVYRPEDMTKRYGWVFFVYGNGGWDSINDHTTNLEEELAPVFAKCEEWEPA